MRGVPEAGASTVAGNEQGARQVVLLLHAHLPECRRPGKAASLEETWFFEAMTECYLPLLRALDRLAADRIPARLSLSVSPTLLGMLQDSSLLERYRERLASSIDLARRDALASVAPQRDVAFWHAAFFAEMQRLFTDRCGGDLLEAWQAHARDGRLELATSAATHAFLPAHQTQPAVIRAQVGVGVETFARAFGRPPTFFWLPECGYFPGLEEALAPHGVRGFALETHGVEQARPPPPDGHTVVRCPNGVCAIGRDQELSRVVWSAAEGYPGDPWYREFHHDRVHALPEKEVARWLGGPRQRLPSGLKYWRVTGQTESKSWYDPAAAEARVLEHARDFVGRITAASGPAGVWLAPFDAELFGHWWFEGPLWLEQVFRCAAREGQAAFVTATEAVSRPAAVCEATPAASTWGEFGDNSVWVNRQTAWLYPRLNHAMSRLRRIVAADAGEDRCAGTARAVRQAARTLLLAQASDWPFLIKAGSATDVAVGRVSELLERFDLLAAQIEAGSIDEKILQACEAIDLAFPHLDLKWFRGEPRLSRGYGNETE